MTQFDDTIEKYAEALGEHWSVMEDANRALLTAFDAVIDSVLPDRTFKLPVEFLGFPAGTPVTIAFDWAEVVPDPHTEGGSTVIVECRFGDDGFIEVDALELFELLVKTGLC